MDPAFRKVIITNLPEDKHFGTVYKDLVYFQESIKDDPDGLYTRKLYYRIDISSKLIYFIEADGSERLYISAKAYKLILITAHNYKDHPDIE